MNNKQFLGVWLPAEILLNNTLADKEKILMSIIFNLSLKEGYCYASNRYLSEILGVTLDRVSKLINKLKNKSLVKIEFEYRDGTKEIAKRKIILNDKALLGIVKSDYTYSSKQLEGIGKSNQDIIYNIKKYKYSNYEQRNYPKGFLESLYNNNLFIQDNDV